ncbi:acyltransferase family protein [Catellatospora vulcania]|uniref:acyltransferase family protein n=1 Tax=Catellatospora vulcania TaxID=1460450 RepID=UPI0012D37AC4|nr:acyltransferase [Catellatospora vulcania]
MWSSTAGGSPADPAAVRPRSPYIDTLRAAAIVRVFLQHTVPLGALTTLLPAMWVMFGLAGYLTAVSLRRGGAARTVRSRLRRLLPPLWMLGAIGVPLMLLHGWHPFTWSELLPWVFPLVNPPGSEWGAALVVALWYLRVYLWFLLLSPVLRWLFERAPVATLLAPLGAAVLLSTVLRLPSSPVTDVVWSTAAYGTAWVLGYARESGLLDRLSWPACLAAAGALGVAALLRAVADREGLHDQLVPVLWGTAVVLLALRARPRLAWLSAAAPLRRVVALLNARAVTVYVWQLPMVAVGLWLLGGLAGPPVLTVAVTAVLTAGAVLCFGWVEDLAAKRPPALLPAVPAARCATVDGVRAPAGVPAA